MRRWCRFRGRATRTRVVWSLLVLGIQLHLISTVTLAADAVGVVSWARVHVVNADRLRVDPNIRTPHGKPATRIEVRPGDDPVQSKFSSGQERAEWFHMLGPRGERIDEDASSGVKYFAVSYKLPKEFRSAETGRGKWSVVFQLHGPDVLRASPAFALYAGGAGYFVRLNSGDLRGRSNRRTILFSDGDLNLGSWTDFVIRIGFATDNSGSIAVWRRNESEASFRKVADVEGIPTLMFDSTKEKVPTAHYWRQGLYRSAFDLVNVLWIGPTSRANSFEEAEMLAFGTRSGKP